MARVLRKILPVVPPITSKEDDDSNHEYSYSFADEYSGPLITHQIPRALPVNVSQIPVAAKVASPSMLSDLPLPVIHPIKSKSTDHKPPKVPKLVKNEVLSRKDVPCESSCRNEGSKIVDFVDSGECKPNSLDGIVNGDECRESSSRLESASSNECRTGLPGRIQSSDNVCDNDSIGVAGRDFEDYMNPTNFDSIESDVTSVSVSSEIFSGREDDGIEEAPHHVRRPSVTFREPETSSGDEEESDLSDFESEMPVREMAVRPGKKGTCYRCLKGNRFTEKEICIVCGAKYCSKCLLRAMGSMPEGRKCVSCIGQRIYEMKRERLGKSSRMLKQLLPKLEVRNIMKAERSCEVNQLPPELVYVNRQRLSQQELFLLQTCQHPPKMLKPGYYWYDKVSGFWGKEGQKPCQIISPHLIIGGHIRREASNGNTNVRINNREITKKELMMLQLIGVKCVGDNHFWVSADGSYQDEGMNNVKGKIWEKNRAKLICAALSLPIPPASAIPNSDQENSVVPPSLSQKRLHKLLLVGYAKSGTSTMFKQAKIVYRVPFSEDERQNIKFIIQSNLYAYLGILLEARERFEEESLSTKKRHYIDQASSSDNADHTTNDTVYAIGTRLNGFSEWLIKMMVSGNLEAIFPASTREYAPLVEELWNDAAIQATYNRRNELESLPRVATYFLERAVEISKVDYEPSDLDILYAEGITSSKGLSSMEFSFPVPSQDSLERNEHDPSLRYQLIRVHPRVLGGNCKWLEMFENVDMVLFCVSLIDYNVYVQDSNGVSINKMMASKQLFESIITHPMFEKKKFLLILNKFDLLEQQIEQIPLTRCEWFHDFNPVVGHNPNSFTSSLARNTNPSLAHRAFQYIATKFKRLFISLTDNKLFATSVTALEPDNVDEALRYAREILFWEHEEPVEFSSSSIEVSTTS
ncbi:extra-large guanine nucleotide-binding protein 1-like [Mercurialis annua]|uniref:extra-large guanine nucleotide-binding protein 1-like n=1 Tax=Mercurialis annua TaxID=3986 RepID=UPI00215EFD62|nr:extra-large guanine nucleotide-binding protein 1-like [Mercurialis annua]